MSEYSRWWWKREDREADAVDKLALAMWFAVLLGIFAAILVEVCR